MTSRRRYHLVYAAQVIDHLKAIERRHHSRIRRAIEEQLQFEPDVETTNKKPLGIPTGLEAEWEIRFGPNNRFRVFYQVDGESRQVSILAIGVKRGNRLTIGGEEVEL